MSTHPKSTVCLVDDDATIRSSLRLMLKSAGYHLLSYASAQEFLNQFNPANVKCIILDVRMPGMSGLELHEVLREKKVFVPILLLTGHADVPLAVKAVKAGAFDVLEKPLDDEVLVDRIERAFQVYDVWQKIDTERQKIAARLARLTPRETEVLDMMVAGKKNKHIAEELGISPKTLDIHRSKVMDKMQARTTADLVRWRIIERTSPTLGPIIDA